MRIYLESKKNKIESSLKGGDKIHRNTKAKIPFG
jgi:hypothetical protein